MVPILVARIAYDYTANVEEDGLWGADRGGHNVNKE